MSDRKQAAVAEGVEKMRAQIAATRARPTIETLDHYASVAAAFAVEAFATKVASPPADPVVVNMTAPWFDDPRRIGVEAAAAVIATVPHDTEV